MSIDKCTKH